MVERPPRPLPVPAVAEAESTLKAGAFWDFGGQKDVGKDGKDGLMVVDDG